MFSAEYGPIVTVVVGTGVDRRGFNVYKGLLAHYSTYFKNALKDCWLEDSNNKINLLDDNPEVFAAFFNWLYGGKLYFNLDADGSIPLTAALVCEIYVFGDARGIPDLCNVAMDTLFQVCTQWYGFPKDMLTYVWDNTMEGAPMRKFLVDFAVENYNWIGIKTDKECFPAHFLLEVIAACRHARVSPGNRFPREEAWKERKMADMCVNYHDHSGSGI